MNIRGIHHITAITGDIHKNVLFYTQILGLRLIKKTVNFDDPSAYHLYYGDAVGTPGIALTFFHWKGMPPAVNGTGTASSIDFKVPMGSLEFWEERFNKLEVENLGIMAHLDENHLSIDDPDGLLINLIETEEEIPNWKYWADSTIPHEYAIRGFHGVRISLKKDAITAEFLQSVMGFTEGGTDRNMHRYSIQGYNADLITLPNLTEARMGSGSIHHVAWQVADDAEQQIARSELLAAGSVPTPQIDRNYFHSIYFREPGGTLFEIATNGPGFTIDEPEEMLGTDLKIPPQYESQRDAIIAALPPLPELPEAEKKPE